MATKTKEEPKDKLAVKNDPRALQFRTIFEGDQFQRALAATLPRHISPARMIRVVLSAMQGTPKLLECTPNSVLLSIMRAASMGLEPDGGPLGQGYLVPYGNTCQFIPGYRGLVKLARNSGEVADVWAEVIYEKDDFKYTLGLNPDLTHVRFDGGDPGEMTHAYAVARFRDGERKFVVLNKREIEKIRDKSPAKNSGPWVEWPAEMWKKTAVRRLSKLLPLSVEQQAAFESDVATANPTQAALQAFPLLALPEEGTVDAEPVLDTSESQEPTPDIPRGIHGKLARCKTVEDVEALRTELLTVCESDEAEAEIKKLTSERALEIEKTQGQKAN